MWTDRQREIIKNTNYHMRNDGGVEHAVGNVLGSIRMRLSLRSIDERQALQELRAYNFAIKKFGGERVSLDKLLSGEF